MEMRTSSTRFLSDQSDEQVKFVLLAASLLIKMKNICFGLFMGKGKVGWFLGVGQKSKK